LSGSSFAKTSSRKIGESYGGEVKGIKRPNEDGSSVVYSGGKFEKCGTGVVGQFILRHFSVTRLYRVDDRMISEC
jgi:hypothetical protein